MENNIDQSVKKPGTAKWFILGFVAGFVLVPITSAVLLYPVAYVYTLNNQIFLVLFLILYFVLYLIPGFYFILRARKDFNNADWMRPFGKGLVTFPIISIIFFLILFLN